MLRPPVIKVHMHVMIKATAMYADVKAAVGRAAVPAAQGFLRPRRSQRQKGRGKKGKEKGEKPPAEFAGSSTLRSRFGLTWSPLRLHRTGRAPAHTLRFPAGCVAAAVFGVPGRVGPVEKIQMFNFGAGVAPPPGPRFGSKFLAKVSREFCRCQTPIFQCGGKRGPLRFFDARKGRFFSPEKAARPGRSPLWSQSERPANNCESFIVFVCVCYCLLTPRLGPAASARSPPTFAPLCSLPAQTSAASPAFFRRALRSLKSIQP